MAVKKILTITFEPLVESHFSLLLRWLETPHVKAWWDAQVKWTPALIEEKYRSYADGSNAIKAYIINMDHEPIGYIQYYNKCDFPREHDYTTELPVSCAAIDWYIGEPSFVGRGIGTRALILFLEVYVFANFDSVFVDPDTANVSAIRSYEKAGFRKISQAHSGEITLMIKAKHKPSRIMIFGRSGSGKSTFAYALHKSTGLPLHHLDKHFFTKNWVERDTTEFLRIQQSIVDEDFWIIDGNSIKSLEMRYSRADLVLYFNYPRYICYWRVFKRIFDKNLKIDDRAECCSERVSWDLVKYMWSFEKRVEEPIVYLREKYPHVPFIEINNEQALNELKQNLVNSKATQ